MGIHGMLSNCAVQDELGDYDNISNERLFVVSFWLDDNYFISPQIVDSLYNPSNDFTQRYYE